MKENRVKLAVLSTRISMCGRGKLSDIGRLQRWVKIAIWCIQEDPEMRPTMGKVNQMLEGLVEVANPPSPNPDI